MSTDDAPAAEGVRSGDLVHLEIPAQAGYARLARIGGAAVALRWGMAARQVQDLRLAVDEAIILLLGDGDHTGSFDVDYLNAADGLVIEVIARFSEETAGLGDEAVDRFTTLVGELVAEYQLSADRVWLRLEPG